LPGCIRGGELLSKGLKLRLSARLYPLRNVGCGSGRTRHTLLGGTNGAGNRTGSRALFRRRLRCRRAGIVGGRTKPSSSRLDALRPVIDGVGDALLRRLKLAGNPRSSGPHQICRFRSERSGSGHDAAKGGLCVA
jgi:hypothetical protein